MNINLPLQQIKNLDSIQIGITWNRHDPKLIRQFVNSNVYAENINRNSYFYQNLNLFKNMLKFWQKN